MNVTLRTNPLPQGVRRYAHVADAQSICTELSKILFDNRAVSPHVNASIPFSPSAYHPELQVLVGDRLSMTKNHRQETLEKAYLKRLSPCVIEVFESVLSQNGAIFPPGFWTGRQGQLNMVICFRHIIETKLGLTMVEGSKDTPNKLDKRLFKDKYGDFLFSTCNSYYWDDLLTKYKLSGAFNKTFNSSIRPLMLEAYPWAFNMDTPSGQHLHLDEYKISRSSSESNTDTAIKMLKHIFTKHLGIQMDEENNTFDKRLLRENQAALLKEFGYSSWYKAFKALGALKHIKQLDPNDQAGKALEIVFPWAFDRSKPEGKHLHFYDFQKVNRFISDNDLKKAILHEAESEGLIKIEYLDQEKKQSRILGLRDLPNKINIKWLIDHRLMVCHDKFSLFKKAFKEEFHTGDLTAADFRSQDSQRGSKPSSFRKIRKINAGTDYGQIQANKTKFYFSKEYIGLFARQESADHFVIYRVILALRGDGKGGRILKPYKVFFNKKNGGNYYRPDIIEYDASLYPILPDNMREEMAEAGVTPQSLSLSTQITIIKYFQQHERTVTINIAGTTAQLILKQGLTMRELLKELGCFVNTKRVPALSSFRR